MAELDPPPHTAHDHSAEHVARRSRQVRLRCRQRRRQTDIVNDERADTPTHGKHRARRHKAMEANVGEGKRSGTVRHGLDDDDLMLRPADDSHPLGIAQHAHVDRADG